MRLVSEYIHSRRGYRFGTLCCWVSIYLGSHGDAPVVIFGEAPMLGCAKPRDLSGYLAAEVMLEHFSDGLPDLPRPLLWVEHARNRYHLLDFPSCTPVPIAAGFLSPVTLGEPRRILLTAEEVQTLLR